MWDVVAAVMVANVAALNSSSTGNVCVPRKGQANKRAAVESIPSSPASRAERGDATPGNDFMRDVMFGGLSGTAMGTALDLCGASVISIYGNN